MTCGFVIRYSLWGSVFWPPRVQRVKNIPNRSINFRVDFNFAKI